MCKNKSQISSWKITYPTFDKIHETMKEANIFLFILTAAIVENRTLELTGSLRRFWSRNTCEKEDRND